MSRGFTLIEFLVTLSISGILLSLSYPKIQFFYQGYQLRELAVELTSFFALARSEALTRRKDHWIHFTVADNTSVHGWKLILTQNRNSNQDNNVIRAIEGHNMLLTSSWQSIKLDGKTGRIVENEHLFFSTPNNATPTLKLITHYITGRVRICSVGGAHYGYPQC